ncbi:TPA: hypothetical protein KDY51_001516 [Vibrio parahaemolyticus]|uniref:hypothetical protein n=1 Tax=Vibrio parahaemolyticus TaxID=670 RepID=UPI001B81E0B2|nr:hypothetical protein [Vibrio parahaemolyticus]MCR9694203.1 hypothetical protein [Vibrio parahaemolyticus]MCR9764421.1 hypothetical protein [Vibrio parahaemolyticus]HBC3447657.1 hypothetical protein [Vibrio parahaemolyticus]
MADKKKPMRLFEEQPDVRFFGLRLVKFVSVIFGSVFFFTLAVTLLDTSALDWKLDVEGIKFFFLDAMKVPGSILAFYLAVLGLIGANHRSEQTKKQIEEASVQNDFANYYKHKEEFLKYVDSIDESKYFVASKMTRMHGWLFPASRCRDFKVNPDSVHRLDSHISLFAGYLSVLVDESAHKDACDRMNNLNDMIQADFGLKFSYINTIKSSFIDQQPWYNGTSSFHSFLAQFVKMFECIDILFQFDPDYKSSEKMSYLLNFRLTWPKVDTLDFNDLEASQVETYKQIASKILQS